ncbi:alpha/beta hydrolase [Actinacidiphila acidipaludis]|uniref:Alpha/beta hydrolase n=1 Tax=Actinacidiphila acidipaludis TaxID=2873382 RepID=A0ABS7QD74_9ACTN|nr:alpha/beta hydrolase [Streptomyces acidipaludis]MBY8881082.1 alpha/beta hydrolase [Streptomyces acidipaludis]
MPANDMSRPTVLLVHGAWHGAWCWDHLTPELERLGWQTATVELPSAAPDAGHHAGMYEDARAIGERLAALDGPVTVLAHSYGGIPATEAAASAANVTRLIYLSAFQLDKGDSLGSQSGGTLPTGLTGTLPPNPEPREYFYNGVPDEVAAWAAGRLVPQSIASFNEPLSAAAWQSVESRYIVCEQDNALPAGFQRMMAARSGRTYSLEAGHSPFLSMPSRLAEIVTADADAATS